MTTRPPDSVSPGVARHAPPAPQQRHLSLLPHGDPPPPHRAGIATLPVWDRRRIGLESAANPTGITARIVGSLHQAQKRDRHPARQLGRAADRRRLGNPNPQLPKNFHPCLRHTLPTNEATVPHAPESQAPGRTRTPTAGTLLGGQDRWLLLRLAGHDGGIVRCRFPSSGHGFSGPVK